MIAAITRFFPRYLLIFLASLPFGFGATAAVSQTNVPNVILTDEVLQRLQSQRSVNDLVASDVDALIKSAEMILQLPTIVEEDISGEDATHSEFLGFGQKPVERITALALAWRLSGDKRYAERVRKELLQLAELNNWYPEHFLGLSRATLGVALGYSWISEFLDEQEHKTIRTALVENGLKEAKKIYDLDQQNYRKGWVVPQTWVNPTSVPKSLPDGTGLADITWPVASFNWNVVCNAGMIVAALVVSDSEPELAKSIIENAQVSIRNGLAMFAPDGAWPEGPMYGALSARDAAILINSLETARDHDFDLAQSVGLEAFGEFLVHATGPTGMLFNFGDSDTSTDPVALTWLASHYDRPGFDHPARKSATSSHLALELIWRLGSEKAPVLPRQTSSWFGELGLVTMRSSWDDPDATYVGLKAGLLISHHNNLDAGTFVLEADGVRWGIDLGLGNYQLPGYFTDKRFDYYRTATIGQNTLTFDTENQIEKGRAQVEEIGQFPGFDFAIADLSDVYGRPKGMIRRGIAMFGDAAVLIQDEIGGEVGGQLAWTMHTEAQVSLDGSTATLRQSGKELKARILSPPDAKFALLSADPCETRFDSECAQQNPNTGIMRLMVDVNLDQSSAPQTVAVLFEAKDGASKMDLVPLKRWRLDASLLNGN